MSRLKKIILFSLMAVGIFLAGSYFWLAHYQKYCFNDLATLPKNKVGLILGTAPRLADGRANLFFLYRVEAAVTLFSAQKVDFLLISGDNHTRSYNEPEAMKKALVKRGIPEEKIIADYAGFRTLDSVVRAKEIFGQEKLTIVSQQFHNERAVFLARQNGIEAVGFNAQDVPAKISLKTRLREVLARARAVLDIFIFKQQPKFLGEKIEVK